MSCTDSHLPSRSLAPSRVHILRCIYSSHQAVTIIYVSTDVDAKLAVTTTAQQPWYRMIFEDDSDFAPLSQGEPEVVEIARGEEFITAMVRVSE